MSIELGKFNQLEVVKEVDSAYISMVGKKVRFCCLPAMCPKTVR
jgi:hypothetical protein